MSREQAEVIRAAVEWERRLSIHTAEGPDSKMTWDMVTEAEDLLFLAVRVLNEEARG